MSTGEVFNHPMRSIAIEIVHTVTETDFGDRHSWAMSGLGSSRDDEAYIRARAERVVHDLAEYHIPSHIVVCNLRVPFPRDW